MAAAGNYSTKTTMVSADTVLLVDSEDSSKVKRVTADTVVGASTIASEIATARGGESTLDDRLDAMDTAIAGGSWNLPWYFNPPDASDFSLYSYSTENMVLTNDANLGLLIDCGSPVTGDHGRAALIALTDKTLAWEMVARFETLFPSINYGGVGLFSYETVAGGATTFQHKGNSSRTHSVVVEHVNGLNTFASEPFNQEFNSSTPKWMKVTSNGQTITLYVSGNGVQ